MASHLGLRCLTMSHLWDARLKWVKQLVCVSKQLCEVAGHLYFSADLLIIDKKITFAKRNSSLQPMDRAASGTKLVNLVPLGCEVE